MFVGKSFNLAGKWTTNFRTRPNPALVTGSRCKPYTRNTFDYRWLCELVLGWRVFGENKCVTRARGHIIASPKARLTQAYTTLERARELVKTMYALTHTKPIISWQWASLSTTPSRQSSGRSIKAGTAKTGWAATDLKKNKNKKEKPLPLLRQQDARGGASCWRVFI